MAIEIDFNKEKIKVKNRLIWNMATSFVIEIFESIVTIDDLIKFKLEFDSIINTPSQKKI